MQPGFKPQEPRTANIVTRSAESEDLMRAKMELIAACDRGERDALSRLIHSYPRYAAALTDLDAALMATSGYERVSLTPSSERLAMQARSRAFTAVFGAATSAARVAPAAALAPVSLKALRQARKLTLAAVARRLSIGGDVLSYLEAGAIRAASVPDRFLRALSETLEASVDSVRDALQGQAAMAPAWRRGKGDANPKSANMQPDLDFLETVRHSPNMTKEQKAQWLTDEQ